MPPVSELKIEVNKAIREDVLKLLEEDTFKRFFFWLIEQTQPFAIPDMDTSSQQIFHREGKRSIGLGLVALLDKYESLDKCQAAYLAHVELIQTQLKNKRKEQENV